VVIVNPVAGSGARTAVQACRDGLAARGIPFEVLETRARGDAEALARDAVADGADLVVAAGGDGTVNEVVNGLKDGGAALAVVPAGTANVLAADIGMPRRPQAIARALAALEARTIRLGSVNGRLFALMAGAGFDAQVVAAVDTRLKRRLGRLAYVLAAARLLRRPPADYTVIIDGRPHAAAGVVVARSRFYGGRHLLHAGIDLGAADLTVCLLDGDGPARRVSRALSLAAGGFPLRPDVRFVAAREVVVDGPAGEPVQADGDVVARLPATIRLHPIPLRLVCPPHSP
jgi:YegS/Rv2252/BmrU family lipid kinase